MNILEELLSASGTRDDRTTNLTVRRSITIAGILMRCIWNLIKVINMAAQPVAEFMRVQKTGLFVLAFKRMERS